MVTMLRKEYRRKERGEWGYGCNAGGRCGGLARSGGAGAGKGSLHSDMF